MTVCDDCGREVKDRTLDGVCAERGNHEAHCSCTPSYKLGTYAGLTKSYGCPIHDPEHHPVAMQRKAGVG